MLKGLPVILGLAILCGFSASTCSAEIDLSKLDASLFREHDLFDIAHEFAVQFPAEVREVFQQLAGEVYGDKSLGDDMFNQFALIDRLRNSTRCGICKVSSNLIDMYLKCIRISSLVCTNCTTNCWCFMVTQSYTVWWDRLGCGASKHEIGVLSS